MRNGKSLPKESDFKDSDFVKSGRHCKGVFWCVAVARNSHGVAVRDTKDKAKKTLVFTNAEWSAFVKGVKSNEFNV